MRNTVPPLFIDVPVRPVFIANEWFQRITRWVNLHIKQDPNSGEMMVILEVQVRHHRTMADGTAGEYVPELVPSYHLTYRADNTEALDLATEQVVLTKQFETPDEWTALQELDPRQLMGRGDAYKATMHAGPVEMVPQIIAAMQAADGPPFYRFGGRPVPAAAQ